eukprot:6210564-Pleurochrysis_carterae.AAC.2
MPRLVLAQPRNGKRCRPAFPNRLRTTKRLALRWPVGVAAGLRAPLAALSPALAEQPELGDLDAF